MADTKPMQSCKKSIKWSSIRFWGRGRDFSVATSGSPWTKSRPQVFSLSAGGRHSAVSSPTQMRCLRADSGWVWWHCRPEVERKGASWTQEDNTPTWPLRQGSWQSHVLPHRVLHDTGNAQYPFPNIFCCSTFQFYLAIKLSIFLFNTSSLNLKSISFYLIQKSL